jgi:hypothetical protein
VKRRLLILTLVLPCALAGFLSLLYLPIAILIGSERGWRMLVGYDRIANAMTGGSDRETISSRANRGQQEGTVGWCLLCRLLDLIEQDHCNKSAGI